MVKLNVGAPAVDTLSEDELAAYFEARRDDESIWEQKAYRLPASTTKSGGVFQLRISGTDLTEIARAAFANGGNVSEFFRSAALEKARALSGVTPPTTADMLKRKLAEAQKLVDELQKQIPPSEAQRVAEPKSTYGTRRRKPKA